jgi:2'-5' RNA ligase
MSSDQSLRLFIAISLPAALPEAIAEATAPVRAGAPGVRWVAARSLHLTLVFLGERPANEPERLSAALGPVCAGIPAFALTLGRPGCFPNAQRPRVLWLGIAGGAEALTALQRAVSGALLRERLAQPEDRFSPHLTLGRVPDTMDAPARRALGASWMALSLPAFPAIPVTGVHVMRSEFSRTGARYTALRTLPLSGAL